MTNVIQFPTGAKCEKCKSRKIVCCLGVFDDGEEKIRYFCAQHQGEFLYGHLLPVGGDNG